MTLNESIVENAALKWSQLRQGYAGQVGELGYAIGHGPHLVPGEPTAVLVCQRTQTGGIRLARWLVLLGRLHEAIRRLNPAIPSRTLATLRDTPLSKLPSGELSVAEIESKLEFMS